MLPYITRFTSIFLFFLFCCNINFIVNRDLKLELQILNIDIFIIIQSVSD